jgi:hypothetical protein
MRTMLTPAGCFVILAGLALLFYAYLCGSGHAEVLDNSSDLKCNNSSLDELKAFHHLFKSPAYSIAPARRPSLPLSQDEQKEGIFTKGSSWQGQGIVALNDKRSRDIGFDGLLEPASSKINYMDIDVSRITVIAINMMGKGSAAATSNIILNPVQYLRAPGSGGEVEEKLR